MHRVKIVFFILLSFTSVHGQSFFKGSAVFGFTTSQIDGDELAGYHKYGITGGVKVEFPLSSTLDMGLEFLYEQRGSRTSIYNNIFEQTYKFHLDYISLPLVIKWSDWWIEDQGYYKFNLHAGVVNAYLVNFDIEESPVAITGTLNNYDLGFMIGGGFAFTKRWVVTLRYNRSILPLYMAEPIAGLEVRRLVGYFITLRSEFNF